MQEVIVRRKNRLFLVVPKHFHEAAGASATELPTELAWFFFPDALRGFCYEKALNRIHEITESVSQIRSTHGYFGALASKHGYSPTVAS